MDTIQKAALLVAVPLTGYLLYVLLKKSREGF